MSDEKEREGGPVVGEGDAAGEAGVPGEGRASREERGQDDKASTRRRFAPPLLPDREQTIRAAQDALKRLGKLGRIRKRHEPGVAPGTITVSPGAHRTRVHMMAFNSEGMIEEEITDAAEVREHLGQWSVTWLNVEGLGDAHMLQALGEVFGIHRLTLEDIVNVHQRPKVEAYPHHYFVVLNMPEYKNGLETEQLSLLFGRGWVMTFQEIPGDCFDPVRERIRQRRGPTCSQGADYLAYALIDVLIDNIFPVLEAYGDRFEDIEERILSSTSMDLIPEIRVIKRELNTLRRSVWPQRDALNVLIREPRDLVTPETQVYLRDCVDHATQLMDLVETFREMAGGLLDMHMSMVSHRMNEVMQVLTIITTIFVPLSFLTGLYGMNFDHEVSSYNMPELHTPYGYPILLCVMGVLVSGLMFFFWRRGWLALGRRLWQDDDEARGLPPLSNRGRSTPLR